jgi:hypothetical protein
MLISFASAEIDLNIQNFQVSDGYYKFRMDTLDVVFFIDGVEVPANATFAAYPASAYYSIEYQKGNLLEAKDKSNNLIDDVSLEAYQKIEIKSVDLFENQIRVILDKIYSLEDLAFTIDNLPVQINKLSPFGSGSVAVYFNIQKGNTLTVQWLDTNQTATYDISTLNWPMEAPPVTTIKISAVDVQENNLRVILNSIFDKSKLVFKIDTKTVSIDKVMPFGNASVSVYLPLIQGNTIYVWNTVDGSSDSYSLSNIDWSNEDTPEVEVPENMDNTCVDSDNGLNYFEQGTTTNKFGGKTDYCADYRGYNLIEYVCEYTDVVWRGYVCPNGCVNGACEKNPTTLNAEYYLGKEDGQEIVHLYVRPTHATANSGDILITVVLEGTDEVKNLAYVKVFSNDPKNRFHQVFPNDKSFGAYDAGALSSFDLEQYSKITIKLNYGSEVKEIIVRTSDLQTRTITKIDPKETDQPIEIPVVENPAKEIAYVCTGCSLDSKCYPFGYRKDMSFCSESQIFVAQKGSDFNCNNSFECQSNVCASDKCVSQDLFSAIINFFKSLFGMK